MDTPTKYYNVYFLETETRLTKDLTTPEAAEHFITTKCPGWTREQLQIREEYCIYAHSGSVKSFRELLHMDPTQRYKVPASISGTNEPKTWYNHEYWFDSLESAQQFMSYIANKAIYLQYLNSIDYRDMTISIL
jgi:hypothetical protein